MSEHDPAEMLSASRVAALLHRGKQDTLDDIRAGRIPSVEWGGRRSLRQPAGGVRRGGCRR